MKIITNNQPRQLLYWEELTKEEKKNFDYLTPADTTNQFVRYKGWVYDVHDMMRVYRDMLPCRAQNVLSAWDAYVGDSYFSGVVLKWTVDADVIMGRYFS